MNNLGLNFSYASIKTTFGKKNITKITFDNDFRISTMETLKKCFWIFAQAPIKNCIFVSPNNLSANLWVNGQWRAILPPGSPAAPWWWRAPGRGDPGRWSGPGGPWPCYTGCCSPPRTSPTPPACPRGPCCGLWTADRCCHTDPPTRTAWSLPL